MPGNAAAAIRGTATRIRIVSLYAGHRGCGDEQSLWMHVIEPQPQCWLRGVVPGCALGEKDPMVGLVEPVTRRYRAVALGLADGERIGLMGTSYGGYSVVSLIAQTADSKRHWLMPLGCEYDEYPPCRMVRNGTGPPRRLAVGESGRVHREFALLLLGPSIYSTTDRVWHRGPGSVPIRPKRRLSLCADSTSASSYGCTRTKPMAQMPGPRDALDDLYRRVVDWFNCHVAERA